MIVSEARRIVFYSSALLDTVVLEMTTSPGRLRRAVLWSSVREIPAPASRTDPVAIATAWPSG